MPSHDFHPANLTPDTSNLSSPLRVLHLEDDPDDAELIQAALAGDGHTYKFVVVQSKSAFLQAIEKEHFDLVLSDFALPNFDGSAALQLLREKSPHTPFILVSGILGEEQAVASLQSGATDYILKNRLLRLPTAVRRALHDARDRAQRHLAEEALRRETIMLEALVNSSLDGIVVVNSQGEIVAQNDQFDLLLKIPPQLSRQNKNGELLDYVTNATKSPQQFRERVEYLFAHPDETSRDEIEFKDGTVLDRYAAPVRGKDGTHYGRIWMFRDITERKQAELKVEQLNKELITSSHRAGMAEVATSVLHNVGNVLNSVNVSSTLIADRIKKSRAVSLARVSELITQNSADLGAFFSDHPKGKLLPGFIAQLAAHLTKEQGELIAELEQLKKNVSHIKDIVAMQQNFAKLSGANEQIKLTELLEDALCINASSLNRHDITIIKDFQEAPPVNVDKHKVLQILVNLIRNAKHACDDSGRDDKQVTLRIMASTATVKVSVSDNGVGIPAENLPMIFNHGFTTKKDGHGFGLHSGVRAAKEMGGALHVHSDGIGCGATFTLELPVVTTLKTK